MRHLALIAGQNVTHSQVLRWCDGMEITRPIVVMVHGLGYCPRSPQALNPHETLFSTAPQMDYTPWPMALGLGKHEGLTIGFGWSSAGTIWGAYRAAHMAGTQLADLLRILGHLGRPIHIIGHSLGARVALRALAHFNQHPTHPCPVRRVILIAPAEFSAQVACPAETEIINVLSAENTLYDLLLRAAFPMSGRTLGHGAPHTIRDGRWIDLRIDRGDVRAGLAQLGLALDETGRAPCHGFGYRRNGIWDLYRALLEHDGLALGTVRRAISGDHALKAAPAPAVAMG